MPSAHKIGAAIWGPRIAGEIFITDMRLFMNLYHQLRPQVLFVAKNDGLLPWRLVGESYALWPVSQAIRHRLRSQGTQSRHMQSHRLWSQWQETCCMTVHLPLQALRTLWKGSAEVVWARPAISPGQHNLAQYLQHRWPPKRVNKKTLPKELLKKVWEGVPEKDQERVKHDCFSSFCSGFWLFSSFLNPRLKFPENPSSDFPGVFFWGETFLNPVEGQRCRNVMLHFLCLPCISAHSCTTTELVFCSQVPFPSLDTVNSERLLCDALAHTNSKGARLRGSSARLAWDFCRVSWDFSGVLWHVSLVPCGL